MEPKVQSLQIIKDMAETNLPLKDESGFVDDSYNQQVVSAYNHNDNLESINDVHDGSDKRVLANIDKEYGRERAILNHCSRVLKSSIPKQEDKVEILQDKINKEPKYQEHNASNPDVKKEDVTLAYILMGLCVSSFFLVAGVELFWAQFLLEMSISSTYESDSILSSMGNFGLILGAIPVILMLSGFGSNRKSVPIKYLIVLEIFWVFLYTSTFIKFGFSTLSETLKNLIAYNMHVDTDVPTISGIIMLVSQAVLLTLLGHSFCKRATHYYRSTRINKISLNPLYHSVDKELEDAKDELNFMYLYLSLAEGKLDQIDFLKQSALELNRASINRWLQYYESINCRINDLKTRINEIDDERTFFRNELNAALHAKMGFVVNSEEDSNIYQLNAN